jgi:hypothetical protein
MPHIERSNITGNLKEQDGGDASLSQQTTASSGAASGATLDRQTTAEGPNRKVVGGAVAEPTTTEDEEKLAGADKPREPSGEEDVDYGKLEEMTAKADGKGHAGVEPETEGYV